MSPPPIRYPLPSLLAVVAVAWAAWAGQGVIQRAASALVRPVKRVVNGPDYPSSKLARVGPGGIVRKVLLLKDDAPLRPKPGAQSAETTGRRGFAEVFDVWPESGTPTDLRIGNGRWSGWVEAIDVLPWSTRLVLKIPAGSIGLLDSPGGPAPVEGAPIAVLSWKDGSVEVATWKPGRPWSEVDRVGRLASSAIDPASWAVLLSDAEIGALRRGARKIETGQDADRLRLRAILGSVLDDRTPDLAAKDALPAAVFASRNDPARSAARLDTPPEVAATWGGIAFRAVPLADLP